MCFKYMFANDNSDVQESISVEQINITAVFKFFLKLPCFKITKTET